MSVLVTGGSKGIGRGIAVHLARHGHEHVFVNFSRDRDAAAEAVSEIEAAGATAHAIQADVGSPEGIAHLLQEVGRHTDRLDVLVHGAVVPTMAQAMTIEPAEFQRAVELNGSALLYLAQAARPLLGRGSSIFLISSRGADVAIPNYVAVGAPKAMAQAIIRYLAVELAPDGIRANTVSVGPVLTDAFRAVVTNADERFAAAARGNPMGRNPTVEDVGAAVLALSRDDLQMVTGRELHLDGGLYLKR